MSDEKTNLADMQEELTAYLDGELDADAVRRVEERLARDPAYENELRRLERAWDMLDRLPRATVDEAFTNTTIEMVAVAAGREAAEVQQDLPRRRRRQRILASMGAVAAGVIGFFFGHWMWPSPNRELLEDLPVLMNLDRYYQADNVDFLRLLDNEGLFADEDNDHAS